MGVENSSKTFMAIKVIAIALFVGGAVWLWHELDGWSDYV